VLTFEVSPDPRALAGRRPGQAYTATAVARLLRQMSATYVTSARDLPLELTKLDRDELRAALPSAFADGTLGEPRDSFLLGGVLRRQQGAASVPPERRLSVLLAGQDQLAATATVVDRGARAASPEPPDGLREPNIEERLRVLETERRRFEDIAEARFKVIRRQEQTLEAYRRRYWRERLRRLVAPKIGTLQQHDPIALQVPERYTRTAPLSSYPVISIVTPSFNQGRFVERTLKSVLDQQYPGLEYVVQDGGSIDESIEILNRHRDALAHVESKRDRGLSHALNLGFQRTTGEIMAYLNSDDLLLPGALHYLADFFLKHADVDVVYGHRVVIDEHDREIGRWILPPHDDDILLWVDYVPQETLFWRRRIWDKVGGAIDEEFSFAVDWELLLRFRQAGARFQRLPRFLGAFRVHPHQKTSSEMDDVGFREMTRLRERYHHRPVPLSEVRHHQRAYLRKHVLLHKLYRLGLIRY
jgi:glycosyltransferase involved in cell wall biosynthesis